MKEADDKIKRLAEGKTFAERVADACANNEQYTILIF